MQFKLNLFLQTHRFNFYYNNFKYLRLLFLNAIFINDKIYFPCSAFIIHPNKLFAFVRQPISDVFQVGKSKIKFIQQYQN